MDIEECVQCVRDNPVTIVGTKLRLSAQLAQEGQNELEALRYSRNTVLHCLKQFFRRALKIRQRVNLPLMVHHIFSTVPLKPSGKVVYNNTTL